MTWKHENYPITKIIYFGFVFITFILLTISLTASCWVDGKPLLQSEAHKLPNGGVYAMYFVILLFSDVFVFFAAFFFFASFRFSSICCRYMSPITASFSCMMAASIICAIVSTSIPMHTNDTLPDFGYGYVLLLCAIYFSLCSVITALKFICYPNMPKKDANEKDGIAYIRYY